MTSSTGEGEDWEEYNRLQRVRREAAALFARRGSGRLPQATLEQIAAMFPLKKRVPRPDVTMDGVKIRASDQTGRIGLWRTEFVGFTVTRATLTAALEILDSPFSWVDDASVEEEPT